MAWPNCNCDYGPCPSCSRTLAQNLDTTRWAAVHAAEKVADWTTVLTGIRAKCPHPSAVKVPRASTGNYDPSADSYWFECSCPDCGKVWQEDQR